jgi:hypothetical protein
LNPHRVFAQQGEPPWDAEPRFELGLPYSKPTHYQYQLSCAASRELRRILKSCAHPTELRRIRNMNLSKI